MFFPGLFIWNWLFNSCGFGKALEDRRHIAPGATKESASRRVPHAGDVRLAFHAEIVTCLIARVQFNHSSKTSKTRSEWNQIYGSRVTMHKGISHRYCDTIAFSPVGRGTTTWSETTAHQSSAALWVAVLGPGAVSSTGTQRYMCETFGPAIFTEKGV